MALKCQCLLQFIKLSTHQRNAWMKLIKIIIQGGQSSKVVTKDVYYAECQCVFVKCQDQCFTGAMMKKSCLLSSTEVNGKLMKYTIKCLKYIHIHLCIHTKLVNGPTSNWFLKQTPHIKVIKIHLCSSICKEPTHIFKSIIPFHVSFLQNAGYNFEFCLVPIVKTFGWRKLVQLVTG